MNERDKAPTMYETNKAVAGLNKVPGFNPLSCLRRAKSESGGGEVLKFDLCYKKLWFRLAYPAGRLKVISHHVTGQSALMEVAVYLNRNDPEPVANFTAKRTASDSPGGDYIQAAQHEAMDAALNIAGFGLQFADAVKTPGEEAYGTELPLAAMGQFPVPESPSPDASRQQPQRTQATNATANVQNNNVAPGNKVLPEPGTIAATLPAPCNVIPVESNIAAGNQPVSGSNLPTENLPVPESNTIAENLPVPESNVAAENLPVLENNTTTGKLPVPENNAATESLPVSESNVTAETLPVSESNITAESPSVSESKTIAENIPAPESKTTAESLLVSAGNATAENLPVSEGRTTAESLPVSASNTTAESLPVSASNTASENLPVSANEMAAAHETATPSVQPENNATAGNTAATAIGTAPKVEAAAAAPEIGRPAENQPIMAATGQPPINITSFEAAKGPATQPEARPNGGPEGKSSISMPRFPKAMPVAEILAAMTYEEACNVPVDYGICIGQTMGDVMKQRPASLKWFVRGYPGDNNALRAAAQIILDTMPAQKAG